MKPILGTMLVTACVMAMGSGVRADEKEAKAVIDKAIKAIGGAEKLAKAPVLTWKTKGTISFNDNANDFTGTSTAQGIERYRSEFEGEFNGNSVKGVTVLDGKKGWRKFGENVMEMDEAGVTNEARTVYLQVIPVTIVPLNGKGFKVESAPDEKVGDKPASVVKATGPDGKSFTLAFDKESGLLVRMTATVAGFNGDEYEQESTFADYKDFGGIKKATKLETKRDGNAFIKSTIVEFKAMDKAAPETFAEPK